MERVLPLDHHWNPSHTLLPYHRLHQLLILSAVFVLDLDFNVLLELIALLILFLRLRFRLQLRNGFG